MNVRLIVSVTIVVAIAAFVGAAAIFGRPEPTASVPVDGGQLVRSHSPIIGRADARVTVVEFFDPACEACRAFYPVVKEILAAHPQDVRLVMRYAPLHEGSDEAVRILEAARRQQKFEPVLEALLNGQPEWAVHGAPDLEKAWTIAASAGLDVERAKRDAKLPEIEAVLRQDIADIEAANIRRTPTFFVNGKPLTEFGVQQLYDLVVSEMKATANGS
jgi:protein-disulfide isomerase